MYLREHALLLWIIEGGKYMRFHEGDCYILHPCGAFQRYKGVPPDSSRMGNFLLQLEGMFRRLPADLQRDQDLLLQAIQHMWEEAGGDDLEFAQRCIKAAVSNVGDSLINKRQRGEDAEVDVNSDQVHWRFHAAKMVLQLKARLVREISEEKLLNYMVEWCETPKISSAGCCFEDCCIEYTSDGAARQA